MAKANDAWTVLPHDPVQTLEDGLWRVEGSLPGMALRRVMTIARMTDGRLVIHNGIALEEAAMKDLEALGEPAFLVVPNRYHRLDAPAYKRRYPEIRVVCPAGARPKVEQVVPVDLDYDAFPGDEAVSLRHLAGTANAEGVMIVRHGDTATVVFNDAVFNMPHLPGFTGFVLRRLTASTGGPRISRVTRWLVLEDKAAFFADLAGLAETPGLKRIVVSHHRVIDEDPGEVLRGLARAG